MDGPISQIVALTCWGNAACQGKELSRFFPANSTCNYCDSIKFIASKPRLLRKPQELEIASCPDDWLVSLKERKIKGLVLFRVPANRPEFSDRMSAGFVGGGGTWYMGIQPSDKKETVITSQWQVWNREAPEQRIWRVNYNEFEAKKIIPNSNDSLNKVYSHLEETLVEILNFASSPKINVGDYWPKAFERSLNLLHGQEDKELFYPDISPPDLLSSDALKILHAAQPAWVFGGMGSWNDFVFEGDLQKEYERCSDNLFQALCHAIEVAASSSYPGFIPDASCD
jgi:hypothetical protein